MEQFVMPERGAPAGSEKVVSEAVANRLKSLYDSVAAEPVPDRFADLLQKLADAEQGGPDGSDPKDQA